MKILSIGSDPAIMDQSSAVFKRQKLYAEKIGELVVVTRTVGGYREEIIQDGLRIVSTASKNVLGSFLDLYRRGLREAATLLPEIITAQDPFEHGLIAWRISRRTGARLHLQVHTDVASSGYAAGGWKNRLRQVMARFLLHRAAAVRVVSQRVSRGLERWGIRRNVTVLPITADVDALLALPRPKQTEGDFTVLTVSRLSGEKRVNVLIRAIAALGRKQIAARLLVAGDGPEREGLEAYAEKLGVADRVEFLGWQPFGTVSEWADCYAQASTFEGYGLSLAEAAARGLPIVTTSVGLVGEVLVPGESCLLARDAASFAQSFAELAADPARRASLGAAAREAARGVSMPQEAYSRRYRDTLALALPDARSVGPIMVATQALDEDDPALGFFCRWLDALAARVPAVTAVCLRRGRYSPPPNVRVFSLGKEKGSRLPRPLSTIFYAAKFKWVAWRERRHYRAVLVHMNQEYVLVMGIRWRLLGKRVVLWRNHYAGSWLTRLAGRLSALVLSTSRRSFTASFRNSRVMPVGVDLSMFTLGDVERLSLSEVEGRDSRSILMLGRLAPSKHVDLLIGAIASLARRGIECRATVVGDSAHGDEGYAASLREKAAALGVADRLVWLPGVPNRETPALYHRHGVFVNASRSGMFDKTIIEAAVSGCRVVSASEDAAALFGGVGHFELEGGASALAAALELALSGTDGWDLEAARQAAESHSLPVLADQIVAALAA